MLRQRRHPIVATTNPALLRGVIEAKKTPELTRPRRFRREKGLPGIRTAVTDEMLDRYAMQILPVVEAGPLEERLSICPDCRDRP